MIFDVGRVCMKVKGRDANNYCVVVETHDDQHVTVDGNTRRRKVNVCHLEPLKKTVKVKKGASTADCKKELAALGVKVAEEKKKKRAQPKSAKPVKQRAHKAKPEAPKKAPAKEAKKEAPKAAPKADAKEAKPAKKE